MFKIIFTVKEGFNHKKKERKVQGRENRKVCKKNQFELQ